MGKPPKDSHNPGVMFPISSELYSVSQNKVPPGEKNGGRERERERVSQVCKSTQNLFCNKVLYIMYA